MRISFRRRRLEAFAVALTLAASGTTLLTGAAAGPASIDVARGQVVDAAGAPVAGLIVRALAEPSDTQFATAGPGSSLDLTEFASTITRADGTWALTALTLAGLPRNADGTVPVLILGQDARGTVMRVLALSPSSSRGLQVQAADVAADANAASIAPTDAVASRVASADLSAGADSLLTARPSRQALIASSVAQDPDGVANVSLSMGAPAAASGVTAGAQAATATTGVDAATMGSVQYPCGAGGRVWYDQPGTYQDRAVKLATAYSGSKTTNWLKYSTTAGSSFEIGVSAGSSLAGFAGMSKTSVATTSGATFSVGSSSGRYYNLTIRFKRYDIMCAVGMPPANVYSGYTQWRPYAWTGGNSFTTWTPFTCPSSYRASTTASDWWISRNKTVTRSGAFTIYGGALKASQSFSDSNHVELHYKKVSTSSSASYTLCGNDDLPPNASLVREG